MVEILALSSRRPVGYEVYARAAKDFPWKKSHSDPIGPKALSGVAFSSLLTWTPHRCIGFATKGQKQNELKALPQAASNRTCFAQRPMADRSHSGKGEAAQTLSTTRCQGVKAPILR